MITIYDFELMGLTERADAVWKGTYLGGRQADGLTIQLFNLETFYAEVCYDPVKNEIIDVRAFKAQKLPGHYFDTTKIIWN